MTLDELVTHPERVVELGTTERSRLLLRLSSLLAAIAAAPDGEMKETTVATSLLTIQQAAESAKVPASWIRQAARDGRLPSLKLGHYRRIKPDDLERFLEEQKRLTALDAK